VYPYLLNRKGGEDEGREGKERRKMVAGKSEADPSSSIIPRSGDEEEEREPASPPYVMLREID